MRLLILAALLGSSGATAREKLVVLDVAVNDPKMQRTANLLMEQVLTELSRAPHLEVLGKSDMAMLLGVDRQRQLLGCRGDGSSCSAEIGAALGAPWLVAGSLSRVGKKLRLDLKLISTRSNTAASRAGRVLPNEDELFAAVSELVRELLAAIPVPAPEPVVEREPEPAPVVVAPPAPAAPPPAAVEVAQPPARQVRVVPWVVTGLGAVAAGVGAGLMAHASSQTGGLEAQRPTTYWSDLSAQLGGLQREYWAGVTVLVIGAVVTVAGILWGAVL